MIFENLQNPVMIVCILIIIIVAWYGYIYYKKYNQPKEETPVAESLVVSNPQKLNKLEAFERNDPSKDDSVFSDYLEKEALLGDTINSHKLYIKDTPTKTTVSSSDTVTDQDQSGITFLGLRRPDYHSAKAQNQPESRVVSSSDSDQLPIYRHYTL